VDLPRGAEQYDLPARKGVLGLRDGDPIQMLIGVIEQLNPFFRPLAERNDHL
jgi:hypothetical protein